MDAPISSPCRRICDLDRSTNVCSSCLRTLEEIVGWRRMTEEERLTVMDDLPRRRQGAIEGAS